MDEDEIKKEAKVYALTKYGLGYYPDVEKAFIAGVKLHKGLTEYYITSERDQQIVRMDKLGVNTTGQCFEQMVNALLVELESIKNTKYINIKSIPKGKTYAEWVKYLNGGSDDLH
jgi:hypothetical protein